MRIDQCHQEIDVLKDSTIILSAMIMYIKPLALTSKSLALVIWGVGSCEIMQFWLTSCLCIPLTNLQLSGTRLEDQPCSELVPLKR